jgi:hypothetical protein
LSDLGEISAEVRAALASLERALNRFATLDRTELAELEAELGRSPQTRQAAALIARARALVRQAETGVTGARSSGSEWLARHGSSERGGSRASGSSTQPSGGSESSASFSSTAVEAVWAEGIKTPGGRAYFTPGERGLRELAVVLPQFAGEYSIDMHGTSDCVFYGATELDAADLAELIAADPNWEGRPVRLFSCNTGRGENPIAAQLARQLEVRVTAPDDLAWSFADGEVVVAPFKYEMVHGQLCKVPDRDREGKWHAF